MVEPGESLHETLVREIREETGLQSAADARLAGVCAVTWTTADEHGETFAFVFEVEDPGGEPQCEDPDGIVREAAFLPVKEAVDRLLGIPWRRMREPAVAFLEGRIAHGSVFAYEIATDGDDDRLLSVMPNVTGAVEDPVCEHGT